MSNNCVKTKSSNGTSQIVQENTSIEEHEEYQYLRLIEKIIKTGSKKSNRTGVDTYSIFGTQMRFGLRDGKLYFICYFLCVD